VGSVIVAVPLVVTATISSLLAPEVLQHDIQLVEPLRPRALVVAHPVVDGLERMAVEPVQPLPSFVTHLDRSHLSEHPQVLGHLWGGQGLSAANPEAGQKLPVGPRPDPPLATHLVYSPLFTMAENSSAILQ